MKYKIEIAQLVDYFVIVVKDKKAGDIVDTFTLNEVGADMLKLFCDGKNLSAIVQEISDMYEAPIDQIDKDVKKFQIELNQKGLL